MTIKRPSPGVARRQATWIVAMDPWKAMGYAAAPLGKYLYRKAKAGEVRTVVAGGEVCALMVLQPDFLLGSFIALLAVRPEAAGKGLGRALLGRAEKEAFAARRWLYVSSDSQNSGAARFYRKAGFRRTATLPDLVRDGRVEWLWRKRRPS
jgi:ribosomal protein S18 acetylase RimI-like enzyme